MTEQPKRLYITGPELGNLRSPSLPDWRKAEIANEIISRGEPSDKLYSWDWCLDCPHQAAIARAAREEFAAVIKRQHPDTIQATENGGDLHAWNAGTIDRVLVSFKQEQP